MKVITLIMLFLASTMTCLANETTPAVQSKSQNETKPELQYNNGYTNVTIDGYNIKFIAEEKLSNHVVQVVAVSNKPEAEFRILNLMFEQMPADSKLTGPAAVLQGVIIIRAGEKYIPKIMEKIPIQIKSVTEYSISEERIQKEGLPYRKKLISQGL